MACMNQYHRKRSGRGVLRAVCLLGILFGSLQMAFCPFALATSRFLFGSPTQFEANAVSRLNSAPLGTDKFVVCYADSGAAGQCRVGSVSGTTISFGTEAEFDADVIVNIGNSLIGVCQLDTDKFAVAYSDDTDDDGYVIAATVSGTTITFGTPVEFSGNLDAESIGCAGIATDKIIVGYNDEGTSDTGTGVVCTVSGTTVTCGTVNDYAATDYFALYNNPAKLDTDKFVVPFRGDDAADGFVVAGTASGTTITWGTVATITTNSISNSYACSPQDADRFVVVYNNETNTVGEAIAGTTSGTTITLGSAVDFNPTSGDIGGPGCVFISATKFVVTFPDQADSSFGKVSICEVDWTTRAITCITETQYVSEDTLDVINEDGQVISILSGYGTNEVKIVLGYIATSGTDDGQAVVAQVLRRRINVEDK